MSSLPHLELERHEAPGGDLLARGSRLLGRLVALLAVAVLALTALLTLAVGVGPRFLPYQALTLEGGSMEPSIPLGSEIVLRPVRADRLQVGDVITFTRPDRPSQLVTHRIVRIERGPHGLQFVTKGDANGVADSWRVPARGTGWRYAFHVPYAGYVVQASRTTVAHLALLALVSLALGWALLRRVWGAA